MAVNGRAVPVIVGPTASGKTAVSLLLAELLAGVEIISADSRQVYRHLDIGTAKPSPRERELVPHHFIDVVDPDVDFNAGEFGEKAREAVKGIFARGKIPVVVGGSGLYIRSLVDGFFEGPGADPEYRDVLDEKIRQGGLPALIEELRRVDPLSASRIDPTKPRRIVRALEVYHATGVPLSSLQSERRPDVEFEAYFYGLQWERALMYERINVRCGKIVADGLLHEAADLERRGYGRDLNALNTVGYKEAFACLHGEISPGEMLEKFTQNTRRYAKRQMTWFRRDNRILWIPVKDDSAFGDVAARIADDFRVPHNLRRLAEQ
jgi:tRNA dimethylallyltransferase